MQCREVPPVRQDDLGRLRPPRRPGDEGRAELPALRRPRAGGRRRRRLLRQAVRSLTRP
ncbi:hypothetical protein [Ornithinimicrobium kibberense]|uniref:hypothetical protein n=1 Tax=Ornithinimicrobium kibberense TaxID=282060 RepID=UPI003609A912